MKHIHLHITQSFAVELFISTQKISREYDEVRKDVNVCLLAESELHLEGALIGGSERHDGGNSRMFPAIERHLVLNFTREDCSDLHRWNNKIVLCKMLNWRKGSKYVLQLVAMKPFIFLDRNPPCIQTHFFEVPHVTPTLSHPIRNILQQKEVTQNVIARLQ